MSTFLELCEKLREECGIAGTISSVIGQTGMHARLIGYIQKANRKIQSRKINWKFLWNEWSTTLSSGELTPPDGLAMFDQGSFWVDAGTNDAFPLRYLDYRTWRDTARQQYIDVGQPVCVTVKPNGKVGISPPPDSTYISSTLTADYWRQPVELVSNGQVSVIPTHLHQIIVAQAKMYWAEYAHDSGRYDAAFVEHEDLYRDLKAHSLPGMEDDGKSESSTPMTIEVF